MDGKGAGAEMKDEMTQTLLCLAGDLLHLVRIVQVIHRLLHLLISVFSTEVFLEGDYFDVARVPVAMNGDLSSFLLARVDPSPIGGASAISVVQAEYM